MERPLRIQYPGAVYHVTARGNERKDIFSQRRGGQFFILDKNNFLFTPANSKTSISPVLEEGVSLIIKYDSVLNPA